VPDVAAALQGARDILAERVAEDAELRAWVRDRTRAEGVVTSRRAANRTRRVEVRRLLRVLAEADGDPVAPHTGDPPRRGEEELSWTIEAPVDELVRA
jgi:protein Tex